MWWLLLACVPSAPVAERDVLRPLDDESASGEDTGPGEGGGDTGPLDTGLPPVPDPPAVRLNEVMTNNTSTWVPGVDETPDFVELHNASAATVSVSRLSMFDRSGAVWVGGEGELAPGGLLVVRCDGRPGNAPFLLDADGDELTLLVDGQVVDRLATGELGEDVEWARMPDGGEWAPTLGASPGSPNPSTPSATLDPTDAWFAEESIGAVHITLSDTAVAALRADRLTYVHGGLAFDEDGGAWSDVGVRLKAYVGSSRTIDQKAGFKIDVNRYVDHRWHGLETITLNNMVQDPTYTHETLAYALIRAAGLPAPRTRHVRLQVNDEDFGLYLAVETVDDRFLRQWFDDPTGPLYEGAYGVDLYDNNLYSFEYDEGPDPPDWQPLADLIAAVDLGADEDGQEAVEALVDLDRFLTLRAIEAVSLHWDGYTTANNYRLYFDPTERSFTMIPWGTDQTFLNEYYGPWSGGGRLFTWCLAWDSCAARYDQKLREMADLMDSLALDDRAEELHDALWSDVASDPRKEFGMDTYEAYHVATLAELRTWPQRVRDAIP